MLRVKLQPITGHEFGQSRRISFDIKKGCRASERHPLMMIAELLFSLSDFFADFRFEIRFLLLF